MVKKTLTVGIKLPTPQECEQLWNHYATPLHIREHMRQVNRVAVYMTRELIRCGEHVIVELVDRASLLHDTIRVTEWPTLSFDAFPYTPSSQEKKVWEAQRQTYPPDIPHAEVNYRIFKDQYPEMATVIRKHSITSAYELNTWEEKMVFYADRRVSHSVIVPLAERLEESYERYKTTHPDGIHRDPKIVQAVFRLQEEIFSIIGGDPDHLPLV